MQKPNTRMRKRRHRIDEIRSRGLKGIARGEEVMSSVAAQAVVEKASALTLPEQVPEQASPEETTMTLDVAAIAYRLWEERGRPEGDPDRDWYEAERQVGSLNGSE